MCASYVCVVFSRFDSYLPLHFTYISAPCPTQAGSESVRHTGATGSRQKEGGKINQR